MSGVCCRACGCDDFNACEMDDGTPCWWVEPDLCSACSDGLESWIGEPVDELTALCGTDVEGLDTLALERFLHGEVI